MKFGRRPAVHNRRTMRSALAMARALDPLGAAPQTSSDYVSAVNSATGGNWGMYLNDNLGDCVCADSAHQVMLHTANAGAIVLPTDDDVLALYEAVGGYVPGKPDADQGCDETAMCKYMGTTGLCGQVSAGAGMIDPTNLEHIKWAVQLFGACRLGVVVGQDSISQFSAHQPWETLTTDPNAGGHDPLMVWYDAQYAKVITWAGEQLVAWALMANPNFLQEAHAEVYPDWVRASGAAPNGFDLRTLLADLSAVDEP